MSLRASVVGLLVALAAAASAAPSEPVAKAPVAATSSAAGGSTPAAEATPADPAPPAAAPPPAPWPPPMLAELPDRDPVRAAIDRAWRLPARSAGDRVSRVQRAAMALGLRDLDGPARALLLEGEGTALERAEQAVALAPGLPAAHAGLARAKLDSGDLPGASKALGAALAAVPSHLEARAWVAATAGEAASYAALGWAVLFAFLGAAAALPQLTHGLGATRLKLAGPAAFAAIGAVVLGLALFEGPAGAALGLGAVAIASGSATKRLGVVVALTAGLFALHTGFERVAAGQLLLAADPLAAAVHRVEAGLPTPVDLGAVLRAAPSDPAAAHAVALHTKRAGDREAAAQYFARVLEARPEAAVFNNAANLAFARGDVRRAIALYEQAAKLEPSAIAYFNLSQAYGRAIRLDEQDRALAMAQSLDADVVERLTGRSVGEQAYVADATFSADDVAARVEATGAAPKLAAAMRERIAPGWLGRGPGAAAAFALIVLAAAAAAGIALERAAGPRDFYADLARTLRAGVGDSSQRVAQLNRLRRQRARTDRLLTFVALVVPGAAGLRFGRPMAALIASAACAAGLAAATAPFFAPPDPLAVGALPGLLVQLASLACAGLYLMSTAAAFVLRVEE